jgi:4-amino-4-deoxy-L-arabinose transferase-like glycosyltransferase
MLSFLRQTPLRSWMLALLCAIYLLAGTVGHDPWKTDDAVHLGIAWEFASHGNWLNPRIGIEAIPGTAPLYHWCAAVFGKTLSFLIPFHDAARLASALFGALLLLGLALAARRLTQNKEVAWLAPVLAIGTLGLLLPLHDAQPAIALLATQAFVYFGVTLLNDKPPAGALTIALAMGAGLWSAGLLSLLSLLPPLLFCLLHRDWRTPRVLAAALAGLLAGIAIGGLWPVMLFWLAPDQLASWWAGELARFNIFFSGGEYLLQNHFELLAWFVWPILPIALWSLWIKRRTLAEPSVLLPLLGCACSFIQLFLIADPKPLLSLHLIVPMVLLALPGAERLRRGASNAFDWFGVMTFTLLAGLLWLGGIAMATGAPARVAKNFYKAEPGFISNLSVPAFVVAGLLTAAWLWVLFGVPRSPLRSATRWAAGVTLMWGLIATLWLPWVDFGKTYRPVALSLDKALGNNRECVASKDVGLAQKASLRYFMDLATRPIDKSDACPWLLIQGASGKEPELKGMKKAWEGNRGGDKSERLRLYRRN